MRTQVHMDVSVQDCNTTIAGALEILQSCTKPSTCDKLGYFIPRAAGPPMVVARDHEIKVSSHHWTMWHHGARFLWHPLLVFILFAGNSNCYFIIPETFIKKLSTNTKIIVRFQRGVDELWCFAKIQYWVRYLSLCTWNNWMIHATEGKPILYVEEMYLLIFQKSYIKCFEVLHV